MSSRPKAISPDAYQALRDALSLCFWYKKPFEAYVRTALRGSPGVLQGLSFEATKREVADAIVDTLSGDEGQHRDVTLELMMELGSRTAFPDIESIKDEADRRLRLSEARRATERLREFTEPYSEWLAARERLAEEEKARRSEQEAQRRFSDELELLRDEYLALSGSDDPHGRGKQFEDLLARLFRLFDMEPRLAYDLEREQIDGSLTYDTDDYIVEARWRKDKTTREHADVFAAKVRRKGKNALGLFVSINGFTTDALSEYEHSTPFIVLDGHDLYLVLDQRVRLDELLRAKKRHANETGNCYLSAARML